MKTLSMYIKEKNKIQKYRGPNYQKIEKDVEIIIEIDGPNKIKNIYKYINKLMKYKKKCIITGSAGFIGFHLSKKLLLKDMKYESII